jgi:hypothetical protein
MRKETRPSPLIKVDIGKRRQKIVSFSQSGEKKRILGRAEKVSCSEAQCSPPSLYKISAEMRRRPPAQRT